MCRNVFDWSHFLCYLAGAIDFDRDGGRSWREEWTRRLIEIGFKPHQILNPCRKPLKNTSFNLDNEAEIMNLHRSDKDWDKLTEAMSQIVHIDLRLVDKSDIIFVNFPKVAGSHMQVPTYGTIHEMVVARQQRKPVYMVWEGGKETCSAWLMWLVGHQNVFSSLDELLLRLKDISSGNVAYNAKDWLLLDFNKGEKSG